MDFNKEWLSASVKKELREFWGQDCHGPRPPLSSLSSEAQNAVSVAYSERESNLEWAKTLSKKTVGEWNGRTEELILLRMKGEQRANDTLTKEATEQ